MVIVGISGWSGPVARRVITIARASSSSDENGTVGMSSTPRSIARSFASGLHDEDPVVQRQLDQVHDERAVVEHERTPGLAASGLGPLDRDAHGHLVDLRSYPGRDG
jgi:hypothetical protein